jgi:hypothetical protein
VCAGAAWAALVGIALLLERTGIAEPPVCLIRRTTGIPCAACGGTRATFAILRGDVGAALALNPGVTLLLVLIPAWLLWRATARRAAPALGAGLTAAIILALFAANWAYVLWHEA